MATDFIPCLHPFRVIQPGHSLRRHVGGLHSPPQAPVGYQDCCFRPVNMLAKWALVHESAWPHLTSMSGAVGYKDILL